MAAKGSTPDRTALTRVAEWAKAEPGVTVAADGTITVVGDTPLTITVTGDDERVQLTHRHVETTADAGRVEAVRRSLPGRGSAVTGTVSAAGTTMEMTLTSTLYIDGLTRQGFVAAFNEMVAATDRAVGSVPSAIIGTALSAGAAAAIAEPALTAAPIIEPVSPDSSPTMVLSAVWAPTHRVPEGGMKAWPKPDPAVEPIAVLQARVELSIAETRGDWARVIGSNGWTGWVDARRLLAMTAPGGVKPARAAAGGGVPLGALGAIALGVAAFLPWFDSGGFTADSFDVALPFLWDLEASGDPALGFGIAGLGALGLIALFVKGVPDGVRRLAGMAGLAATALFAFQVHRGVDTTLSDTIDVLGIGVFIALAGAAVLLISPKGQVSRS
ncbi:MAG: hypothetical protein HZA58_06115 [Acidimicrobiia bacterium]|nr:hypothetical protein [Acidimicrobiia bacterium]